MDISKVVSAMTLEEKCACITGADYWVLGGVESQAVEPIMVSDGPHGLRKQSGAADNMGLSQSDPATCFPTASAVACTFNTELVQTMGEALGDEARDQGVAVLLGPGVNMKRSPLCGRNFEYFSEDPHLAGELAASYIQGVQSRGVGTSLKHYACNNQETNRLIVDSVVDERALHEVYLEPFRIAIEQAQPWTVMTAYNLLNGIYCSENEWLMTHVARGEWGFEGAFVTDWGAQNSNQDSLPAGLDLVMPGPRPDYRVDIAAAVKAGTLSMAQLDEAVSRVLELHRLHEEARDIALKRDEEARLDVARMVAEESAVLLENDGILPLSSKTGVAVIGAFARQPRYQGAGSSKINPVMLDCAYDELLAEGISFTYAAGYDVQTGQTTENLLEEARCLAAEAEVVIVFAGLPDASESEGADRKDMALPDGHNALIEQVCAANGNTAVVLQGGSPVELPWREKPRAILLSYLAGCRGGRATANLLLGKANPSGKLAETWPLQLSDSPCAREYPEKTRLVRYRESIYTGYRFYDSAGIEPAYAFGHGLSYTSFSYSSLQVEHVGEDVVVSCVVRNEGTRAGKETVQVYVAPLDPGVFKAPQQLKAFTKIDLAPGEERAVSFTLPRRAFAHYNPAVQTWDVETGSYELRVSASSRDVRLSSVVEVSGSEKQPDSAPSAYHHVVLDGFSDEAFSVLYGKPYSKMIVPLRPYTINATIGDLKTSLLGSIVHYLLRRELKLFLPKDADQRKVVANLVLDTPLRSLAMSGVDMNLVHGIVDILNYHFIRGFRKIKGLRTDIKQSLASQLPQEDQASKG